MPRVHAQKHCSCWGCWGLSRPLRPTSDPLHSNEIPQTNSIISWSGISRRNISQASAGCSLHQIITQENGILKAVEWRTTTASLTSSSSAFHSSTAATLTSCLHPLASVLNSGNRLFQLEKIFQPQLSREHMNLLKQNKGSQQAQLRPHCCHHDQTSTRGRAGNWMQASSRWIWGKSPRHMTPVSTESVS